MVLGGTSRAWDMTDSEGRFVIKVAGEPSTVASVRVRNGGRVGEAQGVRLSDRNVRVQLKAAATVRGRLVDPDGQPVSGFSLRTFAGELSAMGGDESRQFTGDQFSLNEVPSGRVTFLARTQEGRLGRTEINLAPGEAREFDIQLDGLGRPTMH